jgi:O-antigen/teichoic acid export membrane protein
MAAMLTAFALLVTLVITLSAEDLLNVLFGHSYAQYADIVPILGFAMILTAITSAFAVAFRTVEMPQVGFWGKCLSAIMTMALAVPLIESAGVVGAAIGFVITQLCWIAVYVAEARLRGRLSDEHLQKWVAGRSKLKLHRVQDRSEVES